MKKLLVLFLLLATLLPTLVACADTGVGGDDTTVNNEEIEPTRLDDLPEDLKYNGEDVVVLSRGLQRYTVDEIAVPEQNTEPVNDAMFNRNIYIADRLNVNIVSKTVEDSDPFKTVEEIERVVSFVKSTGEAQYSDEVIRKIEESMQEKDKKGSPSAGSAAAAAEGGDDGADELLDAAVEVILETGQASVSMLQRRLKLGYSRAARLVDQMEERGYVGPFEGSKPRQLLITRAQWQEMQMGGVPAEEAADDSCPFPEEEV